MQDGGGGGGRGRGGCLSAPLDPPQLMHVNQGSKYYMPIINKMEARFTFSVSSKYSNILPIPGVS